MRDTFFKISSNTNDPYCMTIIFRYSLSWIELVLLKEKVCSFFEFIKCFQIFLRQSDKNCIPAFADTSSLWLSYLTSEAPNKIAFTYHFFFQQVKNGFWLCCEYKVLCLLNPNSFKWHQLYSDNLYPVSLHQGRESDFCGIDLFMCFNFFVCI